MFDLKCKKIDCEHNKNYNCRANKVEIERNTECDTYKKSNEAEVGEIEKVEQPAIRKNVKVGCDADCVFNHTSQCAANGITVIPDNADHCPNCCTFMPR